MKTIGSVSVLVLLLLTMPKVYSADLRKAVLHINEPEKFSLLVRTVKFIRRNHPDFKVNVIVNGPAVMRLSKDSSLVQDLLSQSVWVGACSIAMQNNNLPKAELTDGIHYLAESGVVALADFQSEGFAYIRI